ncbi:MAG: NINE protein [Mycobacterium sp.]|jgi:TM2 domain-containing membrane protein YozV|nr:NINE protein [Mycobacterium sp.]MCX6478860.1 NINE protein [Mycobacterium sp.]
MTEPPFGGSEAQPPPYQPPPYYPPPGQFGPAGQFPPPVYPYPYYGDPMAPYGRDPLTGEPLSDKSKVVAGLLQLLGLVGILGIGRIYLGQTGFGIAQLISGLLIGIVTCGIGFIVPVIWGIIDAVLILTGKVRDPQGRPLRDGA